MFNYNKLKDEIDLLKLENQKLKRKLNYISNFKLDDESIILLRRELKTSSFDKTTSRYINNTFTLYKKLKHPCLAYFLKDIFKNWLICIFADEIQHKAVHYRATTGDCQ